MSNYDDDFVNVLIHAGLERRMIQAVLDKPKLADVMMQALKIELGTEFVDKTFRFTPASEQLANVRRANKDRGWGFRVEDFKKLGPAPTLSSVGSKNNLVAVVLEVTLANAEGKADINRTVDELWLLAAARQKESRRYEEIASPLSGSVVKYDPKLKKPYHYDPIGGGRHFNLPAGYERRLRLAEGVEIPKPGLRWRKVNLRANWGKDSKQEIDQRALRNKKSPHVAILAAAWHHPQWIRAMEVEVIPCVRIPGLEGYDTREGQWCSMPSLIWGLDSSKALRFSQDNGGYSNCVYAVPNFVE